MEFLTTRRSATAALVLSMLLTGPPSARAQTGASPPPSSAGAQLDSLIELALATSPSTQAAALRLRAARARVSPAGVRPDPAVMAGIENAPLGREPGMPGPDPMTMRMLAVSQTLPSRGKLSARTAVAEREADAAAAALNAQRASVAHDVRVTWYELAFVDEALRINEQSHAVLTDIIRVSEARYSSGNGAQEDVLKARVAAAQLGYETSGLREQRRALAAQMNALLNRPSETPVPPAAIPSSILRAAVADPVGEIRFASDILGAPITGSPLPPLSALQEMAIESNPMLRQHVAEMAVQQARVSLAQRDTRPDVDVSLQYGQRVGRPDMVSAVVSVPIPIHRNRNQDAEVIAARTDLEALHADHAAQVNQLRSQVAKLYSDIARERTQLALDVKAIIPQGRAVLSAAAASYEAGRSGLLALLDSRSTLFAYETSYYRLLSDFAESVADLEQVVGKEVLK